MNDVDFDFERWGFLAAPLSTVLDACSAVVLEAEPHADFMGGLVDGPWLKVFVPAGLNPLERDGVVRGLLARWFGADVTDWPVPMTLIGGRS